MNSLLRPSRQPPLDCTDDFKTLPFGRFGPLFRTDMVVVAVVRVGALKDKIHLGEDVGRIAGAHELFGRLCRPAA